MKKMMILLFSLILLTGCQYTPETSNSTNVDLQTFLKTVKLPAHFSIDFDLNDVHYPETASIYKASLLEIDENVAIENLLQGEIIATKNYAEGPWFEAGYDQKKEYLTVYDGGKSFGMESGVHGGLTYSLNINGIFSANKWSRVIENSPGPPDNISQQHGFTRKSDYDSFTNLSFKDYKDALSEIEDLLPKIGVPVMAVAETYSLDLETMLEHEVLYQDSRHYYGEDNEDENYTWSKDDEAYLFFFRQMIDDIPLSNIPWQKMPLTEKEMNSTSMTIWYSNMGVSNISAINLLNITESIEVDSLISGTEALKNVIDSYSELLLENETKVFSMELNYVAILQEDDSYELVPAWILGIAETSDWPDENNDEIITLDSYSYHVTNAITGELIERASVQ